MKKLSIILLSILLLSCSSKKQKEQVSVNIWIEDMTYFKDPRTSCCFVKIFPHSMAHIPCEKVPNEMLYIGEIK